MAKRKVDGVLLLDKPEGITSNLALQKAKRLYNAEKAGHTGTLDPFATGLLPLCLGEATKFSQFLLDADKVYLAEAQLGVRTTTADPEGEVIETRPVAVTEADVMAVLPRFIGEIDQVPPMHSALKRDGRPLYEYARKGIEIERQARRVMVHAIELVALRGDRLTLR
ncbi:MAG: tRNA pseudouridine(55) synthase TruB, partial [Hydrogenophilaceae bacterium]